MKRLKLIAAAALFLFAAGCESSRTTTATTSDSYSTSNGAYITVPATVQTSFSARYPAATNVRWSNYTNSYVPVDWDLTDWQVLTPQDYAVTYDMDGNEYYSWYDSNGNWIGSSYAVINYNGLPAAVNNTLTTQYSGYTISNVRNVYWKDRSAYQVEMVNGDTRVKMLVDANGTILKQKTKMK